MHGQSAARADANQCLCTIVADQLVGVDRQRRHAHSRSVNGDAVAVPGAGVAKHPAHLVHQHGAGKEGLRRPAGAVGVTGQKDGFGDVAGLGANVDGHVRLPR